MTFWYVIALNMKLLFKACIRINTLLITLSLYLHMRIVKSIKAQQHSRPHAFKFEACDNGKAGMVYRNWSSEGEWKGDENGNHFFILEGLPAGSPSLVRGICSRQNSMEVNTTSLRSCNERFALKEREWWEKFEEEKRTKRFMWESLTDKELSKAGNFNWYLNKLKKFSEPGRIEVLSN